MCVRLVSMSKIRRCFQHWRSFCCVVPRPLLPSQSCIFICPGTHASFTMFSGPGPFLLNYADNGGPMASRPAVGAYGLLWELQTGTMTPFTICAVSSSLDFTCTGTLLCHSLLDLFPMSDCQSQSLSASVHLSEPLSILWTLGGWPSACKLFKSPYTLPALLWLPVWSRFLSPPLSGDMKYSGAHRRLGCLPNIAGTSGHFWLPRLCRVSLVLGIGVTFLKTDGQHRAWSSYFEMFSECLSLTAETVFWGWVVLLGTVEQKGMKYLKLCFVCFLLFADYILSITQLSLTACHPGLIKQMMKIDDVMVCKSAKHNHFNSVFSHYNIRTIDLFSDQITINLVKNNDLREGDALIFGSP